MAGRPRGSGGISLTVEHRTKIQKSQILNRLISHAEGKVEMTSTQVQAALGLLKKALPDLTSVELEAKVDASDTLKEFLARAAASGAASIMPADDGDD